MDYKKWLIKNYYSLACLVIFAVLFYMGVGNLFGYTLAYDYPFTFFAEHPFSSLKAAISLKDLGHNLYVAPYMNLGIEKTLPHHGPGLAHWIVINDSLTNNIGMHNSMQLLVGLIFISLPFIFINSLKLKKPVKILSLSLTPLLFQTNWVIAYLWGQIGAIMGAFFMFSFFMVYNSKKRKNPWIIAIILSAACIVHFPEGFFLMFFIAIDFAADAYSKRKKLLGNGLKGAIKEYKWLILSAIIFLVITGFY